MEAIFVAVLVLVAIFVLATRRGNELFAVEVRSGRARLVRGRAPAALMREMADVLCRVPEGNVRAVVEDGRPAVKARGRIGPDELQRLRNVVGRFTTAEIRKKK